MRLCASLFRGVAAPLGCVIFFTSAEIAVCTSCAQGFLRVRGEGWYHYPQRALRAAETPDGRLSKRLICRFLRSGGLQKDTESLRDSDALMRVAVSRRRGPAGLRDLFATW